MRLQGGRYKDSKGVSIRYSEGASIKYRAMRIFRKRGGYKVQLNFSRYFFSIFSGHYNFYLWSDWVNIDDLIVIGGRLNVFLPSRNLNLTPIGPPSSPFILFFQSNI